MTKGRYCTILNKRIIIDLKDANEALCGYGSAYRCVHPDAETGFCPLYQKSLDRARYAQRQAKCTIVSESELEKMNKGRDGCKLQFFMKYAQTPAKCIKKLDARIFAGKSATESLGDCPACYHSPFRGR